MSLYYSGSDAHGGLPSELALWCRSGNGRLHQISGIDLISPSWVVPHPTLPLLYVTQETDPGEIVVVAILDDGTLRVRQRAPSHGALPCHLTLAADASQLVASNYLDGTVSAWSLGDDGSLSTSTRRWQLTGSGPVQDRQERSHAHAAYFHRHTLLAIDLGSDSIWALGGRGQMETALKLPPGFGPRHLVFLPRDRAALVGELSSELALLDLSGTVITVLDVVPASEFSGGQPSGVAADRDTVVVANRGVGSFTQFAVAADRLRREKETQLPGARPRAIGVDENRVIVSVQDANILAEYSLTDAPKQADIFEAPFVGDFGVIPAVAARTIRT
jgi:6-phosphogluconolactonase (cycloisomerase 2 family)